MTLGIIIGTFITSILAYLLGSFSFSIAIVKLKTNKDVREQGSKNAGATNASRIIGKKWGVVIMLLDSFKIFLAVLLAFLISLIPTGSTEIFKNTILIIPGFFALVGHCWPVYYKFKGGKAVSCFLGLMLVANILVGLIFFTTWLVLVLVSKKVSIGSIFAAILAAILMWIPQLSGLKHFSINGNDFQNAFAPFVWYNKFHLVNESPMDSFLIINLVITFAAIILLARHYQNIIRLIKGTEPAFLGKNKIKSNEQKEESKKSEKNIKTESELKVEKNQQK
ncbi:glycerol-3-phosphate 1-O-acyltransferase PlsY [Spiroplasma cantharicola]|uniref:Glycerol-3-phosphate acyltransferase n=1 Tax=Spiroplasma cantharicola TaxID=362837 RepID=A0A0M4KCH1_9MOLU|nr:glycerol-3-phosphate 1-O-acyltransferase PlsY [Spiroplasma cantharicola]ALD66415.1 glycerol-3-phosphate acyltransferase PlsY [Spiroplasma cantharicola]